ncbi:MAG: trypsin-like peptidase domain-containing protein, partial [Christensenella sp.]
GAGMLNGHSTAQAPIVNDTGVMQTSADISNSDTELSVSAIAEKAQNSIVEITTQMVQTNQFMQQVSGEASGSGIIISEDGYIITNNHVVEGGSAFTVRLKSGDSYDAKLIGRDPQMDIAVLKVDATGLTPVTLGDSDELVVGDTTVAIGNPLGTLGGTVTNGIVSATNRELDLGNGTMNLIQTNAAINPGNSGGGLFNGQGELIGVVVAKSGGTNIEGLGFAIPINEAKEVADQLMTNGYVPGRIDLGLTLIDVNSQQAAQMYGLSSTGVYIAKMDADSEAAALGIKSGDRIVSLNNVEIIGAADIDTALENCSVGDKIQITIERSGRTADTELTLQEDVPANS